MQKQDYFDLEEQAKVYPVTEQEQKQARKSTLIVWGVVTVLASIALLGYAYLKAYEKYGAIGIFMLFVLKLAAAIILIGQYFKKQKR